MNCQSGDPLAEEQVTAASKEKVLDALGEAASKLRSELGESLATVQKFDVPLAAGHHVFARSSESVQPWPKGCSTRKAPPQPCLTINVPSSLIRILPWATGQWAATTSVLARLGRASEYFTKAFQLREHASEREKLAITADYYSNVTGELDKAAQTYQEEIESYPRDYRRTSIWASCTAAQGQYEKAAEMRIAKASALPRISAAPTAISPTALLALQRFDEARQIIQRGAGAKTG